MFVLNDIELEPVYIYLYFLPIFRWTVSDQPAVIDVEEYFGIFDIIVFDLSQPSFFLGLLDRGGSLQKKDEQILLTLNSLAFLDDLDLIEYGIVYLHNASSNFIFLVFWDLLFYVMVAAESVLIEEEEHVFSVLAVCEEVVFALRYIHGHFVEKILPPFEGALCQLSCLHTELYYFFITLVRFKQRSIG